MQLSTDNGFAFLCAPKCASSSIEAAIAPHCNINFSGPGGLKHITARDYRAFILTYHNRVLANKPIEAFSIVREPTEWLFSWYRYRQRNDIKDPAHPFHHNYTGHLRFEEFVEAYLSDGKRPSFANVGNQTRFHTLEDGSIGVERIFDMASLDRVAAYLSEKLGKPIELPMKNKAPEMAMELSSARQMALQKKLELDYLLYNSVRANDGELKTEIPS